MYILDFLNKIKWDKKENPIDYSIVYFDRVEERNKLIMFNDIKKIEEPFLVLEDNIGEIRIPLHRIQEVRKKGKVVWKR